MNLKLLLVFIVLNYGMLFSQTNSTASSFAPKINIPTSPEAALIERFGNIPIGYNTGTANIAIPIYTIKEPGIEIPIQLRYHSSGIKVADEATWVGLGWDLSPGGSIIQEVRGKRDDVDPFYSVLPENYAHLKNIILNYGSPGNYKYLKHRCYPSPESDNLYPLPNGIFPLDVKTPIEQGSAQPDIYHFNFGNHSGSFYINYETNQIVQLNKTEEINFEKTGNGINAKTSDGILYTFGVIEQAYNTNILPDDVDKVGRTYKLSSITLLNGNKIDFSYTNASSENLSYQERYLITETCSGTNQNVKGLRTRFIQNDIKILSKITTNNIIVDFLLEDREDIIPVINLPNPKRLKAIDISYKGTTNKKVKTFEFGYSYFPYNESLGIPSMGSESNYYNTNKEKFGKRLKLDSFKEIGYDSGGNQDRSNPSYKFEYNITTPMPMKISFSKDFWGYFNGADNKTLLPDLEYFDYNYQIQYFQPANLSNGGQITYQVPFNYGYYKGINRFTDNAKANAYMLNKLYYPTGGYSEFEYESNSFTNQFIPDVTELNKALKHKILSSQGNGNDIYHFDFKLANATTISFSNVINDGFTPFPNPNAPVYTYDNFNPNSNPSRIVFSKTKQGIKTTIKEWKITDILRTEFESTHGKTWNETIRIDFDSDPTVSYSIDIINTLQYSSSDTYRIAGLKSDFYYYDNTGVDTSISNTGGMRIKTIKNYSSNGDIINRKNIKYTDGKLLTRFAPLSAQETFCEVRQADAVNGQLITTAVINNEISISSDNLFSSDGNLVGYGNVEEIEVDKNNSNNGKKLYSYNNYENMSDKNLPIILNYSNGLQTYEASYDKNNTLLFQKNYSYQNISSEQYFRGIININQLSGLSSSCNDMMYAGVTDYTFGIYPLISSTIKLSNTNTKTYFNGNIVSIDEAYTYNSWLEIKSTTKNNSNNEQISTTYYYPTDHPDLLPIEDIMINAKMTGIPLVTENRKNNELLTKQNTQYTADASTNNLILPKYTFSGKATNNTNYVTSEKKVTYDKYDSKGNIQQYTLESGVPVTILWGYNQTQPIAKVENASYSQIATALGTTTANLDTYNEGQLTTINTLRGVLPNAMVTTYTYSPLIGVSSITDPKGDVITFTYDSFGRLLNVRDKDNNILSENKYQYKN